MKRIVFTSLLFLPFFIKLKAQDKKELDLFLKNKSVSKTAKDFYQGKFKAADNARTFSILDSMISRNSQTRPFYLYLTTQIMKISDGALSEEISLRTKEYLEQYPDWALSYFQSKWASPSFISIWANSIASEIMIDCEGREMLCAKNWYETTNKKTSTKYKQTLKDLYRHVSARF